MTLVYLGLGSNLGDREAHLRQALDELHKPDLRLLRVSALYETEPIGLREQPWFLNQVAEFETELAPLPLLHRTSGIEIAMGRRRLQLNGPRVIDIDILLHGNTILTTPELELPHPRYRDRRFVLEPLAELNPNLPDPVTSRTIAALRDALRGQTVRRLASAVESETR